MLYFVLGAILPLWLMKSTTSNPVYPYVNQYEHKEQLIGIPDLHHFHKIHYPKFDIIHLGEYHKETVPPAVIHVKKKVKLTIPKPYPVKVPVPVHHPVPIAQPYPVVETKYVQVPHPVPYEVVKPVPVPYEVPKPYPVPKEEYQASPEGIQQDHSFGTAFNTDQHTGTSGIAEGLDAIRNASPLYGLSGSSTQQDGGWSPLDSSSDTSEPAPIKEEEQ